MSLAAEIVAWRHRRAERPLPRVRVEHGRSVPGGLLRLGAAVAVGALVLGATSRIGVHEAIVAVLAGGLVLWTAARPGRGPAYLAVAVAGVMLLGSSAAPFDPAALWLAPLGYLTVRLIWFAERTGWHSRIEIAALRHSGSRDLLVVLMATMLGGLAWAAAGTPVGGLVIIAGAALLALTWVLLPR